MATTRDTCPFCRKGEVATDDVRRVTSHTAPLCDGYRAFLNSAKTPPVCIGLEVLDDNGAPAKGGQA